MTDLPEPTFSHVGCCALQRVVHQHTGASYPLQAGSVGGTGQQIVMQSSGPFLSVLVLGACKLYGYQ
eukprot:11403966-Karenia_brevis.AAC.1